jgi:hypothetical protein
VRPPRVPEKVIQAQGVTLLRTLGAKVYVLGTTRRRGDFHGTMQTPGIADVFGFLPTPSSSSGHRQRHPFWWEAKAEGGRLRHEQREFREFCQDSGLTHIVGDLDNLIAFLVAHGWLKAENLPHYRLPKGSPDGQTQATEKSHVPTDPA